MPLGYNSYKNKIKTPSTRTTLPQGFGFLLHWPPLPENQGSSFCQLGILILITKPNLQVGYGPTALLIWISGPSKLLSHRNYEMNDNLVPRPAFKCLFTWDSN